MNITELIADLQLHFPASDPKEVAKALLAQQVCIKQKDAALQRCTKFTQEDYDALELKPHAALVAKIKADAVREAIQECAWTESQRRTFSQYADRIERREV